MSAIEVSHLTFAYDGAYEDVFTDVSFTISADWKLGLCGRNGRGKTTLLNLLLGKYEYRGNIAADMPFAYFPCAVPDEGAAALDAAAMGAEPWRARRELSLLGVDENAWGRPFCTLSGGERVKVLLAGLFLRAEAFLLIDEPTDHLDAAGRKAVAQYLRGKGGYILVSHDRAFLDACTDHTLAINKRNIEIIGGNFSAWWAQKQRQDAAEAARNEKLAKDVTRLKAAAGRTAGWSDAAEKSKIGSGPLDRGFVGHKAAKMMKRSKAIEARREQAAEEKSKLLRNVETADALKLAPLAYFTARLASASGLSVNYGGGDVFDGLDFEICGGDRAALVGGNGCGKSSVLKLVCGEEIPHGGLLNIGSGLKVSYVPQDASFLRGGLSAFAQSRGLDEPLFKAVLRKLGFERAQFDADMRDFSAGLQKKTLLAASLCERAHLYVWDEPLNYVDVFARMQIEELILTHRPTLLFVEHDAAFRDAVATKHIAFSDAGAGR